jgi:hypothetical protein
VAAAVAVAVLGGGVVFLTSGSKEQSHAAAPPPAPAPVAAPAPKLAPPAAVVKPPVAPLAATKVTVRLATDPQGAKVLDASGLVLGTTPFSLSRPKGGAMKVRLEKDGYISSTRDVPLDEDQSLEFALEHKPAPRPKKERKEPRDTGPAKL